MKINLIKKSGFFIVLLSFFTFFTDYSIADEIHKIEDISVNATIIVPTKQSGDILYTGTEITRQGLEFAGENAKTNAFGALEMLPDILLEQTDPYGLGTKNIRIRGIKGYFSGLTMDGIPNYGIFPIGPRDELYDMDNMESISVYKGAIPSDLGTATGNKGGVIEMKHRKPADKRAFEFSQSFGLDNYSRSFLRVDTGETPMKNRAFFSYSLADADKWKGEGELGPRNHLNIGVTQDIKDSASVDFFVNYNDSERHSFKNYTYQQTKDIDYIFKNDFNGKYYGVPSKDINYYDYNRGKYTNTDLYSKISFNIKDNTVLLIKPYYSNEDSWYLNTASQNNKYFMRKNNRDLERFGIIPEINTKISGINITAGYWYESNDFEKYAKNYSIQPNNLVSQGYQYYAKNKNNGYVQSPYIKASAQYGRIKIQGGLKYFYIKDGDTQGYVTPSPSFKLQKDPDTTLDKLTWDEILPSIGIGYNFSDNFETYFNYGRNYMRPYVLVPITNVYVANRDKFKKMGMTLQDIIGSWEMETSDYFDVGIRYKSEYFDISPVVFYSKHDNVLANVFDPNVKVNYYQNAGKTTAYGVELETMIYPLENLSVFFNPAYISMTYNDDFVNSNNVVKIKDNQVPDVPEWNLKTGFIYKYNKLQLSSLVTWTDSRFGDAENKEKINSHTVVDFMASYNLQRFMGLRESKITLEINNIFDTKYVGLINVSDDTLQGSASYYAGTPFTAIFGFSAKF